MASCGTFQKLSPLSLLSHLSSCYDSAHLKVNSGQVSWSTYLEEGEIVYASHSVAPFDRLDCHLHRLSRKISTVTSEVRAQLSLIFEHEIENQSVTNSEYQAVCWLVNHQYLNSAQAAELIEGLVAEVLESLLLIKSGTYELGKNNLDERLDDCRFPLQPIIDKSQKRLQAWESLGPQIWSPYQRLHFSNSHSVEQQILLENNQKLSSLLKGFSFRHLAVLLNQDEFQLAQSLHQHIVSGTILLQDPYPPFNRLPRTSSLSAPNQAPLNSVTNLSLPAINNNNSNTRIVIPPIKSFTTHQPIQQFPSQEKVNYNPVQPAPRVSLQKVEKDNFNQTQPETINSTAKQTVPPSVNPPPVAQTAKGTYKIVCVDDSPAILQELNRCLEDELFSVSTISNPVKALMQIIKIKPDLILLDVNMAGIDGYELCRLLRNHSLFKNIPIIMVTGNTGIINRVKAKIVGASGYITKPFTQSDLLKIVFRHLS